MKLLSRGVVAKPSALSSSISSRRGSGRPACTCAQASAGRQPGRGDLARQPLEERRVRAELAALVEEREHLRAVVLRRGSATAPAVRLRALPALEHLARDPPRRARSRPRAAARIARSAVAVDAAARAAASRSASSAWRARCASASSSRHSSSRALARQTCASAAQVIRSCASVSSISSSASSQPVRRAAGPPARVQGAASARPRAAAASPDAGAPSRPPRRRSPARSASETCARK